MSGKPTIREMRITVEQILICVYQDGKLRIR